jgi:hypothetical protein
MYLYSLPGLVLSDIHDSLIHSVRYNDVDIMLPQRKLRWCIPVHYGYDRALRVPPCVHDPNVGWGLLVDQPSVDHRLKFFLPLIGDWHILISPQD